MPVDRRLLSALHVREVEGLLTDLRRVCVPAHDGQGTIFYIAKQLGLFGDRMLPPEIEVVRVLRDLSAQKRLVIARDALEGAHVTVRMRSGLELVVCLRDGREKH